MSKRKPSYSSLPENNNRVLILSVDDEEVNQTVLRTLMPEAQYEVVSAYDGFEALMYLNDCRALPDIVLLDIMMPGMSGFEVCSKVREDYSASELPIIIISAKTSEEDIIRGLGCGANDYLTKPIRHLELQARITTQLAAKKAMSAEAEAASHHALLAKMLPDNVISRLKNGSQLIAEKHPEVTILFSDIVNFTTMASVWPTERIVMLLDEMFTAFDGLCDRHGVYKVETIGDAYMVVCGHRGEADHAVRVVNMALSMLEAVSGLHSMQQGEPVRIRIGVHTGPAHSGVVGVKCPRYCFFGDTVNTASRMESHGFPMAIHCSSSTRSLLTNHPTLEFVDCGPRPIKGKGLMTTYIVKAGDWEAALDAVHDPLSTSLASMLLDTHASNLSLNASDSPLDLSSQTTLSRANTGLSWQGPSDTSLSTSPNHVTLQLPAHASQHTPAADPVATTNTAASSNPALQLDPVQARPCSAAEAQSGEAPCSPSMTRVSFSVDKLSGSRCSVSSDRPDVSTSKPYTSLPDAAPAPQQQSPTPATPVPATPPSPFLPSSRLPFGPPPPLETSPPHSPPSYAAGNQLLDPHPPATALPPPTTQHPHSTPIQQARPICTYHPAPPSTTGSNPPPPLHPLSTSQSATSLPAAYSPVLSTGMTYTTTTTTTTTLTQTPSRGSIDILQPPKAILPSASSSSLTLLPSKSGGSLSSPTSLLGRAKSKGSAVSPTRAQEWFKKQRMMRALANTDAQQQQQQQQQQQ